jgi:hypothetical protein
VVKISQAVRRAMSSVQFDNRWPAKFDLADEWPQRSDWWAGEKYIGPKLQDIMFPATWATKIYATQGRPGCKITDPFRTDWMCVTKPAVFVNKRHVEKIYSDLQFNRRVRPFSDVDDTARLFLKIESAKCDCLIYDPSKLSGVANENGIKKFNVFRPSLIKPKASDPKPFLDYMEHLIPDAGDRHELLRWVATLIARPDIKMMYGVLLISEEQGVGKSTLGEKVCAPIIGEHNCSFPEEKDIVDSNYTYWKANKRLAVCHEIYQGHSWKAYNTLKSTITDKYIPVRIKYQDEYDIDNWMHILACSNSLVPMKVSLDDRRWFVPMVTEEKQPLTYWIALNQWLKNGGHEIIAAWATEFLQENEPVLCGANAPMTSRKEALARDAFTPGQEIAYNLARRIVDDEKLKILVVSELIEYIKNERQLRSDRDLDKPQAIRKACVAARLFEPERRGKGMQQQYEVDGRQTYIVANQKIGKNATWPELKEFRVKPETLEEM